jgi:hypothetical protein
MTNLVYRATGWRRDELVSGTKSASGSGQRKVDKLIIVIFKSAMAGQSTMEKVSAPKKFPMFFVIPWVQPPNPCPCPSSPAAREPISVAISFYHSRKQKVMMQKAIVSHGKPKMDKWWGGECYPAFVVQGRHIKSESFVVRLKCKKRCEGAKKKQKTGWRKNEFFVVR